MSIQMTGPAEQAQTISSALATEEYKALRATIRERGSLRHLIGLITFSVWAATMLWVASGIAITFFMLVPLLVLAAGFEVGFALHVGVERIGRYLQVRYESDSETLVAWERTAMALSVPSGGVDPLFLRVYAAALSTNLILGIWVMPIPEFAEIDASYAPVVIEFAVFVIAHAVLGIRWIGAQRYARVQRAQDLTAFLQTLGVRNSTERQS